MNWTHPRVEIAFDRPVPMASPNIGDGKNRGIVEEFAGGIGAINFKAFFCAPIFFRPEKWINEEASHPLPPPL
jgi:hypothetical protein